MVKLLIVNSGITEPMAQRVNRFSKSMIAEIDKSRILGIRAGKSPHRFTGVWPIVVDGRLFIRSWDDRKGGWHQSFIKEPEGAIQVGGREIAVRARQTRSERLLKAIDAAYAEKYRTPASRKWVRGLIERKRQMTTTELIPLST